MTRKETKRILVLITHLVLLVVLMVWVTLGVEIIRGRASKPAVHFVGSVTVVKENAPGLAGER